MTTLSNLPQPAGRRDFLRLLPALVGAGILSACRAPQAPVRIATVAWIGYEPHYLAQELGLYAGVPLKLVETPSNTNSPTALASGEAEAAGLTLDENILARESALDLRVVLVMDESAGADVIMARPEITDLAALRGRRVGVEDAAAGALMLAKLLESAGLRPADIKRVYAPADQHIELYRRDAVDAVVSIEPNATRLAQLGARRLLDSRRFPGLIVDVLAVRAEVMENMKSSLCHVVAGFFTALEHLKHQPRDAATRMALRMGLTPEEVLTALEGVRLLDRAANQDWLAERPPKIEASAREVARIMHAAGLISSVPDVTGMADAGCLGSDQAGLP